MTFISFCDKMANMEELICTNCKHFNGQCQNFYLSRVGKTKRKNANECEYWEERSAQSEEGLKAKLLDIASQLEEIAFSLRDSEK